MTKPLDQPYTIEVLDIEALGADPANINAGTPRGEAMTDFSLDTFGPARGVALDRNNLTIAGNKTVRSARRAGVQKVVVVETDGDVLVATRRRDMDLLSEKDKRAREYSVADNRTGEIGLAWDVENMIAGLEEGADYSVLFYDDELARLTGNGDLYVEEDETFGESEEDPVPEMALQPFEHYDYVLVIFRSSLDWSQALDVMGDLGLVRQGFTISKDKKSRKIGLCRVIEGRALLEALRGRSAGLRSTAV